MDLHENWPQIRHLFSDAFRSSLHYAIATVGENGEPHVTPIGSLVLGRPGSEKKKKKFTRRMPRNLADGSRVCVLAVNSSRWFWIRSLFGGRFRQPPAIRLYGTAGTLRAATPREIALWQKRVRPLRFSKGHALMWRDMDQVREIHFDRIEPVNIGPMTVELWTHLAPPQESASR